MEEEVTTQEEVAEEKAAPVKVKEVVEEKDDGILTEDVATILFTEITQGYREWTLGDKKYRTRFATPKEDADARMEYATAFNSALAKNLPTQKQMLVMLKAKGIWTNEDEAELAAIREKMNQIELILSKKDPKDKSKTTRKMAEQLLQLRGDAIEKASQLNEFMGNTIESIADENKQAYYVSSCTENPDGSRVWATPEDFMNSRETNLVSSATYEYVTFINGLAENYVEMLPEVQFMRAGKDE
jgi:hypothetical protein